MESKDLNPFLRATISGKKGAFAHLGNDYVQKMYYRKEARKATERAVKMMELREKLDPWTLRSHDLVDIIKLIKELHVPNLKTTLLSVIAGNGNHLYIHDAKND